LQLLNYEKKKSSHEREENDSNDEDEEYWKGSELQHNAYFQADHDENTSDEEKEDQKKITIITEKIPVVEAKKISRIH